MTDLTDLSRDHDLSALQRWLEENPTLHIAEGLSRLAPPARAVPFLLLSRDRALAVFEALDPVHQQEVLEGLRDDRFSDLVEGMDPDDRARLVGELPAKVATRLLAGLSDEERAKTAALLGYPEESAGRVMSPDYVSLRESMTVADALAKVRRDGVDAETVYALPVTDDERRLRGIVSLRQLVLSPPDRRISELMQRDVYCVHATDDREGAARLIQEADILVLPVLDSEDRLVGIITVDDAMEVIEAEETEDRALHGATQPLRRPYLAVSVLGLARSRAAWLLVLLVAAALTVNVMQHFSDEVEAVTTLALFIPLVIDTGGNAGSQASTVVTRALAVGELRFSDLPWVIWREARVGLLMGFLLAAVAYVPVAVVFNSETALTVSTSLVAVCTWATFAGAMLPMLARRVGVDPAVVSAPLITTLVDAIGLVTYFLVARAVFGL